MCVCACVCVLCVFFYTRKSSRRDTGKREGLERRGDALQSLMIGCLFQADGGLMDRTNYVFALSIE